MTPGRSLLKTGNKAGAKIDSVWKICRNPKKSKRMTLQLSFSDWIKKNMNLFKNIFRNNITFQLLKKPSMTKSFKCLRNMQSNTDCFDSFPLSGKWVVSTCKDGPLELDKNEDYKRIKTYCFIMGCSHALNSGRPNLHTLVFILFFIFNLFCKVFL